MSSTDTKIKCFRIHSILVGKPVEIQRGKLLSYRHPSPVPSFVLFLLCGYLVPSFLHQKSELGYIFILQMARFRKWSFYTASTWKQLWCENEVKHTHKYYTYIVINRLLLHKYFWNILANPVNIGMRTLHSDF
jgi:hypothetical protein